MPMFQGCKDENCTQREMMAFISRNIVYPVICKENNITGRVYIEMVVSKTGKVINVKLVPGSEGRADENLEKEGIRVVKKLPNFSPGRQQGKAANVKYTIPIVFELN